MANKRPHIGTNEVAASRQVFACRWRKTVCRRTAISRHSNLPLNFLESSHRNCEKMIDLFPATLSSGIVVRAARVDERELLEEIQRRASLANPDDRQAILDNPQVIDLPLEQILSGSVLVALVDVNRFGFAVVLASSEFEAELDGLFVEPSYWRRGVARRLLQASCELARVRCARSLSVIANYQAGDFYKSSGFIFEREVSTQFGRAARMRLQL